MLRYNTLLNQYLKESLFEGVSPMSRKSFIRNLQVIGPWGLSAVIVPTKHNAGKTSSSSDSYQAKDETQNGSGTPTSQKSGVTLTIQYNGTDGSPIAKIFKISREKADAFIEELNNEVAFPSIEAKGQTVTIPAKNITEIRVEEEEDVNEVGKSKGKKTSDMGSGKTS